MPYVIESTREVDPAGRPLRWSVLQGWSASEATRYTAGQRATDFEPRFSAWVWVGDDSIGGVQYGQE